MQRVWDSCGGLARVVRDVTFAGERKERRILSGLWMCGGSSSVCQRQILTALFVCGSTRRVGGRGTASRSQHVWQHVRKRQAGEERQGKETNRDIAYLEVIVWIERRPEVGRLPTEQIHIDLRSPRTTLEHNSDLVRLQSVKKPRTV
jgi:hypothetical protein